ncbi:hypothetical protein BN946_scf184888.g19 [Trametes cinnabarina]|uniref:Saccharopine dehydrogenase NADP binding domain-containing protein n=1 Tax=Pycnoporus cinnabarinus TaxID=5643 RepID=A0A060SUR7_PYCCI|nr:hypothetical protein BN946_scf184888.g19 [Trametes cinnabarina]
MPDILVVGATGFTGRLITRYLLDHPQRTSYTLGIGVRSKSKGKALKKALSLDDSVNIVLLDITRYDEVEAAVKNTNLVINAVGPFWNSGEAIVQACVHHGKKYVDITGEALFIRELIDRYDELATKTSAIIVPACGFDCVPADLAVYLSNQTLKRALGPYTDLGLSQTFYSVNFEFSGGSRATLMSMYEDAPRDKFRESYQDYALSPVRGFRSPCLHLPRPVPLHSPPIFAAPYVMAGIDRAVVQRTFGLNQLKFSTARMLQGEKSGREQEQLLRPLTYGSQFRYGEFLFTGSGGYYRALLHSVFMILTLILLRLPAASDLNLDSLLAAFLC